MIIIRDKDIAMKVWLKDKRRFADLFNGIVFNGKKIIKPDELMQEDVSQAVVSEDNKERIHPLEKYRDVVMKWNGGAASFVILACENQNYIDYTMPIRTMLYDAMNYTEQLKEQWKNSIDEGYKPDTTEFMSKHRLSDKLHPVITLVCYYGEDEWTENLNLHSMLDESLFEDKELLEAFVPDYHINLINMRKIDDTECFDTDLRYIFELLKYDRNKEDFVDYIRDNQEYFSHMEKETYEVAKLFLKSKTVKRINKVFEETDKLTVVTEGKEAVDMCKALEDFYADGVNEGIAKGIEQGIEQGIERGIRVLIETFKEIGKSQKETMEKVKEKFALDMDTVALTVEKYWD